MKEKNQAAGTDDDNDHFDKIVKVAIGAFLKKTDKDPQTKENILQAFGVYKSFQKQLK